MRNLAGDLRARIGGAEGAWRLCRKRLNGFGTIGDYAIASASNFLLAVGIAHSTSVRAFGAFSLAYSGYLIALGVSRSLIGEPLLVLGTFDKHQSAGQIRRQAIAESWCVGLAGSVVFVLIAFATHGIIRNTMLIFGAAMPMLILQDTLRYVAFALRRSTLALWSDGLWLACQAVSFAVILAAGGGAVPLLVAWALCGAASAVIGLSTQGAGFKLPKPRLPVSRHLGFRYLGEFATSLGSGQLILAAVALLAGLEGTGAVRGGQIILGPLVILQTAMPAVAIPLCVRARIRGDSIVSIGRAISIGMVLMTCVWGAIALLLPDSVGAGVLGDTWPVTRALMAPQILIVAFQGVSLGAMVGLRASLAASESLRLRAVLATLYVLSAGLGAVFGGASGALWCWALSTPVGTIFWWRLLRGVMAGEREGEVAALDNRPLMADAGGPALRCGRVLAGGRSGVHLG